MIGFYLSFQYKDTFNILLEYAEEGTLEEFYANKPNPTTGQDTYDFWASFLEIVKGITLLHKQRLSSGELPPSYGRAEGGTSLQGFVHSPRGIQIKLTWPQMASRPQAGEYPCLYRPKHHRLSTVEIQSGRSCACPLQSGI